MVHRREINGEPIVFGNQGDLYQNAMTWFDHDTGSVWSQPLGEAILGPLKGETLELLPSTLSTWEDWKRQFPDTLALDTRTVDGGFSLDQLVVVGSVNGDSAAIAFRQLSDVGALSTEIGGEPVLFVADPEIARWAVFSRLVDGEELNLELRDGEVFDPESGHRWDPGLGAPRSGQGTVLDRVPAFSSFGSDYRVFFPDGELIDLDGEAPLQADRLWN